MVRGLRKETYYIAFLITAGIFLLGLLLGLVIDGERADFIQEEYQKQKITFTSSQLQYELFNVLQKEENCPAMFQTFYSNLEELEKTRERLEEYDNNAILNEESFTLLQREYLLEEIQYWLLATDIKKSCNFDVVTILYFYSNKEDCPDCDEQSFVLSYLKELFGDKLLIFSFNAEVNEEPLVSVLETAFNITAHPGLVIDENSFTTFIDKNTLLEEVCSHFKEPIDICLENTSES